MSDDIVTLMRDMCDGYDCVHVRQSALYKCDFCEAADEIERLRELMKAFVSAWERSELGENNGTEYFNAVHAMREAVRGE